MAEFRDWTPYIKPFVITIPPYRPGEYNAGNSTSEVDFEEVLVGAPFEGKILGFSVTATLDARSTHETLYTLTIRLRYSVDGTTYTEIDKYTITGSLATHHISMLADVTGISTDKLYLKITVQWSTSGYPHAMLCSP